MFISTLKKLLNWVLQILSSKKEPAPEVVAVKTAEEYTMDDKDFYNQASAEKLGWNPSWFGAEHFDDELVLGIGDFQIAHDLPADGLCGPMTYRRAWTDRQANLSSYTPPTTPGHLFGQKYIVHNGNFLPIEWDKVKLWFEPDGLAMDPGTYYDNSGKADRKPTQFTYHWDVCLSAESCVRVLNKKRSSVQFCLDNDGTIYQILDTQHGAWHCGKSFGNRHGIGIEISNAYYTKYQSWYEKHSFGPRPVIAKGANRVHGVKMKEHLGFYPVQMEALKALTKAIHDGLGIPLECPVDEDGSAILGVDPKCNTGEFAGFNNHYNYTRNKIDCAGIDMLKLLAEVKESI
jgi:hypothetical protein